MILKINGLPVEELVKEGVDVSMTFQDAFQLIHTPINLDVGTNVHHLFNIDMNLFNIPHHTFHFIRPHLDMVLERLF